MKILIIDGDLIAYRSSAAAEERKVLVKHLKSGKEKEFKNRTEFKKFLEKKEIEFKPEAYDITDIQSVQPVSVVFEIIKSSTQRLEEFAWADKIEIYLGKGSTFRHKLALPSPYKDQRDGAIKPHYLDDARNYMISYLGAKVVQDIEVDDMITIRAYEERAKGNEVVLATVDKDAYQSQGICILNYMKDPWVIELIPEVGELRAEKNAVKGNGLKFLAYQVLAGDPSDTYKGYELSSVKYGPMKALKALESANTEQDILRVLVDEYKRLYAEPVTYTDVHGVQHTATWLDLLRLYWKVAYMKRSKDDNGSFDEYAKARGVEV